MNIRSYPLEKNIHSITNATLTFSSLVFLANFFYINHSFNAALYFSNIMSLVISSIMMYFYPDFLFDKYGDIFLGYFHKYILNGFVFFIHVIPLYLFQTRQTIIDLLDMNIILESATMLLSWYAIFQNLVPEVYPMSESTLFYLCLGYYSVWMMASIVSESL